MSVVAEIERLRVRINDSSNRESGLAEEAKRQMAGRKEHYRDQPLGFDQSRSLAPFVRPTFVRCLNRG